MNKIFKNGTFLSVNLQGDLIRAEAVVIDGGKFVYAGDDKGAERFIKEDTQVIDLEGKMVVPGLSDGHVHPAYAAGAVLSADLYDVKGTKQDAIRQIQEKMAQYINSHPDNAIIKGCGFEAGIFIADGYPTKVDLDQISAEKAIVLQSSCGHCMWVNSKALELAGIAKETEDPAEGIIHRDEQGAPTGFLQEMDAMDMIAKGIPGYDFSVAEYKQGLKDYQKYCANAYGVTMVFDALATENAMKAYEELEKEGNLTMRVRANHYADPAGSPEQFDLFCRQLGGRDISINLDKNLVINTVKFFMDGTGMAFYMNEPFEKEYLMANGFPEDYRGFPIWAPEETKEAFFKLIKAGYQIHVHAMGDGAVTQTIDALEYVYDQLGTINRSAIAHVMCIKDRDIKRMARMGIIAIMQPCWMVVEDFYENYYVPLFGRKRAEGFYPMKSFLDAGVVISSGTDFPVTPPPNPYYGIQCAMTRSIWDALPGYETYKGKVLGPSDDPTKECITIKEVIQSLTMAGAYQHFLEDIAGSIEVGKSADMVVLNQDLEKCSPEETGCTLPVMTVFRGEIVYSSH